MHFIPNVESKQKKVGILRIKKCTDNSIHRVASAFKRKQPRKRRSHWCWKDAHKRIFTCGCKGGVCDEDCTQRCFGMLAGSCFQTWVVSQEAAWLHFVILCVCVMKFLMLSNNLVYKIKKKKDVHERTQ